MLKIKVPTINIHGYYKGNNLGVNATTAQLYLFHDATTTVVGKIIHEPAVFAQEWKVLKHAQNLSPYIMEVISVDVPNRIILAPLYRCEVFDSIQQGEARQYMAQLAHGVKALHDQLIVHRDLKPSNLFISHDNCLKIGDFGVSTILSHRDEYMTGREGTGAYQAPEVHAGIPYDRTVDNWSLGVLLFVMHEEYHPFDHSGQTSERDIEFNIQHCRVPTIEGELNNIIQGLTAMNPSERLSLSVVDKWMTKLYNR